jgi:hypothetical protein
MALKDLLDRKTVGFLNFFLSSDGQSILLGENWVHRLNEALKTTKLMFVFVSKEALQSEWIENKPHEPTAKLFGSEIRTLHANWFLFRDLRFSLVRRCDDLGRRPLHPHLTFHFVRHLSRIPLPELLSTLLERQVLMLETKALAKQVHTGQRA